MLGVGRDSTSSEVQSVYLSRGYREGVEAVGVGFSQHHTHTHAHSSRCLWIVCKKKRDRGIRGTDLVAPEQEADAGGLALGMEFLSQYDFVTSV